MKHVKATLFLKDLYIETLLILKRKGMVPFFFIYTSLIVREQ
jgi:hypothetical protein